MAAPMALYMESNSEERLSKQDRRLQKKHNRHRQILKAENGVEISDTSSNILCIGNAGLGNGVDRERVYDVFHQYGEIVDILMIPQKSYCFVTFSDISAAESASAGRNGFKLHISDEECSAPVTIYIFYVSNVPEVMLLPFTDLPPGLILELDFVTEDYERHLLENIDWTNSPSEAQRNLKHRRVKHYGFEFKYGVNNVDPDCPLPEGIPSACDKLIDMAFTRALVKHRPDQLTINQYSPGQGIPSHVDTLSAFEDGLMALSLGSQAVMDFQHPDGRQTSVLLPRRSLLVMTGESRYIWSHGITPRKSDIVNTEGGGLTLVKRETRTSFTFRKIVVHQDSSSQNTGHEKTSDQRQTLPQTPLEAARLECEHVHKVYEQIAGHFSSTRHSAWPKISQFVSTIPQGSLMVDIGCGNGKYLGINKSVYELGSDRSANLVEICHARGHQAFVGDVLNIPLRSDSFDVCLCIAVIHHLSTQERRIKAVEELVRMLVPGGQALIYVWAMEQQLFNVKSKYLKGDGKTKQAASVSNVDTESDTSTPCLDNQDSATGGGFREALNQDTRFGDTATINADRVHTDLNNDGMSANACDIDQALDHPDIKLGGSAANTDKLLQDLESEKRSLNNCDLNPDTKFGDGSTVSGDQVLQVVESENMSMNSCDLQELKIDSDGCEQKYDSKSVAPLMNPKEMNLCTHSDSISCQNCTNSTLKVHVNRTPFKQQDMLVPWHLKKELKSVSAERIPLLEEKQTFHRFYHVFKEGELESLCQSLSNVVIRKSYYDQGNWCVLLEKVL